MHVPTAALCLGLLLAGAGAAQLEIHPDEIELKPEIDAAISRGVEALLNTQVRNGTWGRYGNYDGGKTALCAYALMKSGVSVDHPAIRRAMLYLRGVRPRQTYTVACMMLAYSAAGTKEHLARMKQLARLLIAWQQKGDFGYPFPLNGDPGFSRPDLSNTQYAALGLWIAQHHKLKIPTDNWRRLIDAVLQYQSKPEFIIPKQKATGKRTSTGVARKVAVIGFGYRPKKKPTGSMTTAGISILQICKIGLSDKLGKDRQRVEGAIESALGWLAHHFRVSANPGATGSWPYYYLYGLERVGSLTRTEQIGDHWWYVEGARHLIQSQNAGDDMWHARGKHPEVKTAFALLFLRRASSLAAPVTGKRTGASMMRHFFVAGDEHDPAAIGGTGQQPLSLWIKGFGDKLKERHKKNGIRVVQVEYLEGERTLGQLVGDPTQAWATDSFFHRVHALSRGPHQIRAQITIVAPDVPRGLTTPTEKIESPEMKVMIRDVFADWMEAAADLSSTKNLMRTANFTVTATSNPDSSKRLADGDDSSHWVCDEDDERPEITIEFEKSVFASRIVLSQAGFRTEERGLYDHILNVEVYINGKTKPLMIEMDENQMAVTSFELPRRLKIHDLRFRIVLRFPGRRAFMAGFSEIGLMK